MFGSWCTSMGIGGWLLMIGVWVALIVGAVWAIARILPTSTEPPPGPTGTAREILDERLATGQVDPATYERLRRDLMGKRS